MISALVAQIAAVALGLGLAALVARTWQQHKRNPDELRPAARSRIAAVIALSLGASLVATYGFSIAIAKLGADSVRREATATRSDGPARARVFLRAIQVALSPGAESPGFVIGFSPSADLALPHSYGLYEAYQRRDVVRISVPDKRLLTVAPLTSPDSDTRVIVGETLDGMVADRKCASSPSTSSCSGRGCVLLLCQGDSPRVALELRQALAGPEAQSIDVPIRVEPRVWNGRRFRLHHLQLEAGELVQMGATSDALPGLSIWEVPAPPSRPALMFPPEDLLGSCEDWVGAGDGHDGGFFHHPSLGSTELESPDKGDAFACYLPFGATQPFALEVRRLVPDVTAVATRGLWAALFISAPVLLWLLALLAARPSARGLGVVASAGSIALWATVVSSVAELRLLWAHRLDMLREYESVGSRVVDNDLGVVFVAAAVALTVVLRVVRHRIGIVVGLLVWSVYAGVGLWAVAADLGAVSTSRMIGYAIASLAIGSAAVAWPIVDRASRRVARKAVGHSLLICAPTALAVLVAWVAAVSGVTLVFAKLLLAAVVVSAVYLPLRRAALAGASAAAALVVVLGVLALAGLAAVDTGVASLYGGIGFLIAVVLGGFDALYSEKDADQIAQYRTWLHPVVALSAIAVVVICIALVGLSVAPGALGLELAPSEITWTALALLGLVPVVYAGLATLIWRRRGPRLASTWIALAGGSFVLWLMRVPLVDLVLGMSREAAKRVAAVIDPGYAILQDDAAFSRSLTAWREASLATPDGVPGASELVTGQGYFGAQVVDPGVLLSIDNDYLPVLVVRELGALGLGLTAALLLALVAGCLWIARTRFSAGSAPARWRTVLALVVIIAIWYQPMASLGVLPFTGVSLPGLGVDSPSDWWIFVALIALLTTWGRASGDEAPEEARAATSWWPKIALASVLVAAAVTAARAGSFALSRPAPVKAMTADPDRVEFSDEFAALVPALDYAFRAQCPAEVLAVGDESVIPDELLTDDRVSGGAARFDRRFRAAWSQQRDWAERELRRFIAAPQAPSSCTGDSGNWHVRRDPTDAERCELEFAFGWPRVTVAVSRDDERWVASCDVDMPEAVLRTLRYPVKRPFAGARVRLVSRAMGRAAEDVAELVAGNVVLRLRPDAGEVDVADVDAGVYYASRARIGEGLTIEARGHGDQAVAVLAREQRPGLKPATLLTQRALDTRVYAFEPARARWQARRLDGSEEPTSLSKLSVIVTGQKRGRTVWLFRRATPWTDDEHRSVNPLLVDDVATVLGARRRFYVYGGLLPELGWVNPWSASRSLGLDGWVKAALSNYSRRLHRGAKLALRRSERFIAEHCPATAPAVTDDLDPVCSASTLDGVLECRVSLQPELAVRFRHLLEITSLMPTSFVDDQLRPATSASVALLRGDTGEIVAQGHFVPGRESTAYAPATPSLERYLVHAREDRDPQSGRRSARPEESGAEKVGWNQPVALGSVLKPLVAAAVERVDADWLSNLRLGTELRLPGCKNGIAPILGYCPRTKSLWNSPAAAADVTDFLGRSLNWFQAGLGLLATGIGGEIGLEEPGAVIAAGGLSPRAPLRTRYGGREVLGPSGIDLGALRSTPVWAQLEAVVGRRLCPWGSKAACRARDSRRDLCAARALPIDAPSRDLRHLVALGPRSFDFLPEGRFAGGRVPVVEYLELLRGSGAHPVGSITQIADAFARVFFEPVEASPPKLAASWFPVARAAAVSEPCSSMPSSPTRRGLCRALAAGGTARSLGTRLSAIGVTAYGAKTGTIDSLGDIVDSPGRCQRYNVNHTVPGAGPKAQPFHLRCGGKDRISDSLIVAGFGVAGPTGEVPLVLALRYQGVGGHGFAAHVADVFVEEANRYFAARPKPTSH